MLAHPASDEARDWVNVYRGPDNQWRCQHRRPVGRLCNRLLAVNEAGTISSKRGDHEVRVIDLRGSATGIKCTECHRWNWILSDGLSEDDIAVLSRRIKSLSPTV